MEGGGGGRDEQGKARLTLVDGEGWAERRRTAGSPLPMLSSNGSFKKP